MRVDSMLAELEGNLGPTGCVELPPCVRANGEAFLPRQRARLEGGEGDDPDAGRASLERYTDLASFYDAASPTDDGAKALVGAYWMQFKEGVSDVEAMTVNTRLKHLGHGVGNITRAFEALKAEKPSLIVQTRKEGSTKQARKKFKVTNEGKKRVEGMLAKVT